MVGPIRRDLGISDTGISLLMGPSFAIFYALLGFPIGRLADRVTRRGIIAWGIIVWSLMTTMCGAARNYWQLFLARVGVGVGEAALSPATFSLLADYFPRDRLGTAISVYSMGICLGSGIALMLGGWIVGEISDAGAWTFPIVGSLHPWQAVFVGIGLPGLLLAPLARTIREPLRGAMGGATAEGLPLRTVTSYVQQHARAFLAHNFGFAFLAMVSYGWAFWIPTFLIRNHGWTPQHAGFTYGLWVITFGATGVVIGGYLSDVLARRGHADAKLRIVLIGVVGELLSSFLFLFAPTDVMEVALIPATFFASFGFGAGPAAIQEITPVPMRAQTSALYVFIVSAVGLGIGSTVVAALTDYVFKRAGAIRDSLLVTTVVGLILAGVTFLGGLAPFRRAVVAAHNWRPGGR